MRVGPRAGLGLAGGGVLLVSLVLYVPTLLPDVGTWDTAEFQAIGPVLGIAHPTGYPTYSLLAWLASVVLQPFGNEAYRADLLSSLLVAWAASLLAVATVQVTRRWPLGIVAGLAFAVTPIAWRLSTRADAHALHAFLAALLLVLLLAWAQRAGQGGPHAGRWLVAASLVFGLSLGNHALTLLLAPGIAAYVLLVAPRILWQQWRVVLGCLAVVGLTAVAVYAYLPLRSAMDPPLDYADPEGWGSFWYVVLGQQFQGSFGPLPPVAEIVADIWDELVRDLGLLAVLVPAGLVIGAFRYLSLVVLTGLWFACTWLFALGYPNASIERYYLVPLMAACLWIALAADGAWDGVRAGLARLGAARPSGTASAERALVTILVLSLLAVALAAVPGRREHMDASDETYGRDWLEATFAALEPDAAVLSWWSFSTPLWYGRWVEGRRDDIIIVDDRDVLDDGFGRVEAAIDHFLGQRPVYIVRLDAGRARPRRALRARARRHRPEPGRPLPRRGPARVSHGRHAYDEGVPDTTTAESPAPARRRVAALSYFFPAHDEAENIEALVAEALVELDRLAERFEIICVDDGSTDGTARIADELTVAHPDVVRAVHHPANQGYGAAVRSGLRAARYPLICFTDGDRQFRIGDLAALLARLDASEADGRPADVVAGYRIRRADPRLRLAYARVYRACLRLFFGLTVRDPDCACKLFRREALAGVRVESGGAFLSAELLIKIGQRGGRIVEQGVPHHPRTAGRASGADPRVVGRAVRDFWALRLRLWADRDAALRRGLPVLAETTPEP